MPAVKDESPAPNDLELPQEAPSTPANKKGRDILSLEMLFVLPAVTHPSTHNATSFYRCCVSVTSFHSTFLKGLVKVIRNKQTLSQIEPSIPQNHQTPIHNCLAYLSNNNLLTTVGLPGGHCFLVSHIQAIPHGGKQVGCPLGYLLPASLFALPASFPRCHHSIKMCAIIGPARWLLG